VIVPFNDIVKVYVGGNTDSWGIYATTDNEPTILKGFVEYSPTRRKLDEGEKVYLNIKVTFKGEVDIPVGAEISIDDGLHPEKRYKVLEVYPIKDMGGKTVFTKVVV
jgi:hypothetical protein